LFNSRGNPGSPGISNRASASEASSLVATILFGHLDKKYDGKFLNKQTALIRMFSAARASQQSACLVRRLQQPVSRYHKNVIDHYENPRNVGSLDKADKSVGTGLVGAPACGDVMKLQIKANSEGRIIDAKFKTFGCGSAIASSSLATEWVKGKTVNEASSIRNSDIAKELKLPPVKLHCSSKFRFQMAIMRLTPVYTPGLSPDFHIILLAEDAIKAALSDYKKKQDSN
ncbi:FeS cluster assembly scaffold IscU, partial [Opisthorchis viverrini]